MDIDGIETLDEIIAIIEKRGQKVILTSIDDNIERLWSRLLIVTGDSKRKAWCSKKRPKRSLRWEYRLKRVKNRAFLVEMKRRFREVSRNRLFC